jgi:hypothetical protein
MDTDTHTSTDNSPPTVAEIASDTIQKAVAEWGDKAYRAKRIAELIPTIHRAVRAEAAANFVTGGVACKAVAASIGVTSSSLYNWMNQGVIPSSTSISLLQAYIERRRAEGHHDTEDTQSPSSDTDSEVSSSTRAEKGPDSREPQTENTMPTPTLLDLVLEDLDNREYFSICDLERDLLYAFRCRWYTPTGDPRETTAAAQLEFEKSVLGTLLQRGREEGALSTLATAVLEEYRTAWYGQAE